MAGMYVLSGSRSSSGKRAGPTIYELNARGAGRSAQEILRLIAAGLAITWRAGRRPTGTRVLSFRLHHDPRDRERSYLASLLTGREREVDCREVLDHTAIVFQDFMQYALSARDNIALGRHERASDTAGIVRAAEQAGADRDISALPEGYQTLLGPAFIDGTDLSTGQWQRLALARTFFRDAPLVILDEPTAALDAKAEHELFARIGELFADRSVLLISHRFSTVRSADRIYVLNEGKVMESGAYEELLAADGTYAELFTLQAAPYQ